MGPDLQRRAFLLRGPRLALLAPGARDSISGGGAGPPSDACERVGLLQRSDEVVLDPKTWLVAGQFPTVQYWVSGSLVRGARVGGAAQRRANIAVLLRHDQNHAEGYVERLVLGLIPSGTAGAEQTPQELELRYFRKEQQIKDGFPPYAIFTGVYIPDDDRTVELRYLVRGQNKEKIVVKNLGRARDLQTSRLRVRDSDSHNFRLPPKVQQSLEGARHDGFVTTPVQIPGDDVSLMRSYAFQAYVERFDASRFTLHVVLSDRRNSEGVSPYRHIFVLDPAGRPIAIVGPQRLATFENRVTITETDLAEEMDPRTVGRMIDCPYCMVVVETEKLMLQQMVTLK